MPIFEYRCDSCSQQFEYLVIGEPDPQCEACGSRQVHRMMSVCGFISKGGGGAGGEASVKRSAGASACSGCSASSCAGCGS